MISIASIVINDGQIFGPLFDKAVNELLRNPSRAEATNQYGGSVLDSCQSFLYSLHCFINHALESYDEIATTERLTAAWCRSVKIRIDRKSTRLISSHVAISYAVFCLKKKKIKRDDRE